MLRFYCMEIDEWITNKTFQTFEYHSIPHNCGMIDHVHCPGSLQAKQPYSVTSDLKAFSMINILIDIWYGRYMNHVRLELSWLVGWHRWVKESWTCKGLKKLEQNIFPLVLTLKLAHFWESCLQYTHETNFFTINLPPPCTHYNATQFHAIEI